MNRLPAHHLSRQKTHDAAPDFTLVITSRSPSAEQPFA
jgi:hypothetical protein